MALERLDDDEKLTSKILMSGQNRDVWLISDSGMMPSPREGISESNDSLVFSIDACLQWSLIALLELWVAKDVCEILELDDVRQAVERLDEDERLTGKIYHSGQNRDMWLDARADSGRV